MPRDPHTKADITVDFAKLLKSRLETMLAADNEAGNCIRVLLKTGDNIVGALLRGTEGFYLWDHYPDGDIYDHETHAQFYYHAHALRSGENGHFHTFMRANGIPDICRPVVLPDYEKLTDRSEDLSHLIAIWINPNGLRICMFSTNRWVTGETCYRADDVCSLIDRFEIDHAQPSRPVNRWVTSMLQFFHLQAVALIRAQDQRVKDWAAEKP